jgi:hypothetical protein
MRGRAGFLGTVAAAFCAAILAAALPCAAAEGPAGSSDVTPKVADLVPRNGATDVEASLGEIRIVFDRTMSPWTGFSGDGRLFPKTTGKPHFINGTTCVLPVNLEPGRSYEIKLNFEAGKRFTSYAGQPGKPLVWRFRTSGTSADKLDGLSPDEFKRQSQQSCEELERAVENHYAYLNSCGVDWTGRFEAFREKATAARDVDEWMERAAALLEPTRDTQIRLAYRGKVAAIAGTQPAANWNEAATDGFWPPMHKINDTITVAHKPDGTGFLRINSIAREAAENYDALPAAMSELWETHALILDLRKVTDGSSELSRRLAGWFTSERRLYALRARRDMLAPGGWTDRAEEWLEPAGNFQYYSHPVIVLTGQMLTGEGERLVMMLKACPNVATVGGATYGCADRTEEIALSNGVSLRLPTVRVTLPDGTCVKGRGVMPDSFIDPRPKVFAEGDPVFELAMDMARHRAGVVQMDDGPEIAGWSVNRLRTQAPQVSARVSRAYHSY